MTSHTTQRVLRKVIDPEVACWPGASWSVTDSRRGGHARITVAYGERTRFVVMSSSPGDRRFHLNLRAEVRRELAALGARRAE